MCRLALVLGLLFAVGNVSVLLAGDFVPAKPRAGAPSYAAEVCKRMDERRSKELERERQHLALFEKNLAAAKKAAVAARSARVDPFNISRETPKSRASTIAAATAKVDNQKARVERLEKSPIFAEEFFSDLRVNDVGVIDEPILLRVILSDSEAIADVYVYEWASELGINSTNWFLKPIRRQMVVVVDTRGVADGSKVEIKEAMRVSGTRQIDGRTLFVLEPANLDAIVEQ